MDTTQPIQLGDDFNEDTILNYTHTKRKIIVESLLGKGVPDDPAVVKVALAALDGMSRDAIGRKRIKVEEKTNKNQESAAALIAQLLSSSQCNGIFKSAESISRATPKLGTDIPAPVLVKGETSTIPLDITYDSFVSESNN